MKILYKFGGKNSGVLLSEFESEIQSEKKNKSFFMKQIHSSEIFHLKDEEQFSKSGLEEADALITRLPNIIITVKTADCIPILIFDKNERIIAAIHSGHMGSFLDITSKTIKKMKEIISSEDQKECKETNFQAIIGPHIFGQSYEVGIDFYEKWIEKDLGNKKYFVDFQSTISKNKKYKFDNCSCIYDQLIKSGIAKERIEIQYINTFSNKEYYSYRAGDKNNNERNLSMICMI